MGQAWPMAVGEVAGVLHPAAGVDRAAKDHGVIAVDGLDLGRRPQVRLVAGVSQGSGNRVGDLGGGAVSTRR